MLVSAEAFPLKGTGVVPRVAGLDSLLLPDPRFKPLRPPADSGISTDGVPTLDEERAREDGTGAEVMGLSWRRSVSRRSFRDRCLSRSIRVRERASVTARKDASVSEYDICSDMRITLV